MPNFDPPGARRAHEQHARTSGAAPPSSRSSTLVHQEHYRPPPGGPYLSSRRTYLSSRRTPPLLQEDPTPPPGEGALPSRNSARFLKAEHSPPAGRAPLSRRRGALLLLFGWRSCSNGAEAAREIDASVLRLTHQAVLRAVVLQHARAQLVGAELAGLADAGALRRLARRCGVANRRPPSPAAHGQRERRGRSEDEAANCDSRVKG
jgi:hypothetical protein